MWVLNEKRQISRLPSLFIVFHVVGISRKLGEKSISSSPSHITVNNRRFRQSDLHHQLKETRKGFRSGRTTTRNCTFCDEFFCDDIKFVVESEHLATNLAFSSRIMLIFCCGCVGSP
ncbi:unnamed protein product, partial [Linum tenue]